MRPRLMYVGPKTMFKVSPGHIGLGHDQAVGVEAHDVGGPPVPSHVQPNTKGAN